MRRVRCIANAAQRAFLQTLMLHYPPRRNRMQAISRWAKRSWVAPLGPQTSRPPPLFFENAFRKQVNAGGTPVVPGTGYDKSLLKMGI